MRLYHWQIRIEKGEIGSLFYHYDLLVVAHDVESARRILIEHLEQSTNPFKRRLIEGLGENPLFVAGIGYPVVLQNVVDIGQLAQVVV